MVRPGLLFRSVGRVTYVPFGGNAPEAMPRVVARNVDPDDSVPNTVIIRLDSIDCREREDDDIELWSDGATASFIVAISFDVRSKYIPRRNPRKSRCIPFEHRIV
mmetsp:Transcript_37572/g.69519  ORF Transcript_37572/g.69519 Transcript_37572/m.69519 type:complete len:105 (+) Transcript_37572:1571-1885(+)